MACVWGIVWGVRTGGVKCARVMVVWRSARVLCRVRGCGGPCVWLCGCCVDCGNFGVLCEMCGACKHYGGVEGCVGTKWQCELLNEVCEGAV